MIKRLISFTLAAISAVTASAQTYENFVQPQLDGSIPANAIASRNDKKSEPRLAPAREGNVTFGIQILNKPASMTYYMAGVLRAREDGSLEMKCGGPLDANGTITWNLSDVVLGKGDAFAILVDGSEGMVFMQLEGVEIADNKMITFDVNDANITTKLQIDTPAGTLDLDDIVAQNVWTILDYKGVNLICQPRMLWGAGESYMRSNVKTGPYTFYKVYTAGVAHRGIYGIATEVDFSKATYGATADGWQSCEENFTDTPFIRHYNETFPNNNYTSVTSMLTYGNEWWSNNSFGCLGFYPYVPGGKINIWKSNSSMWGISLYPVGDETGGYTSATRAMPVVITPEGIRSNGRSLVFEHLLCMDYQTYNWTNGNSRFYSLPTTSVGNCTPALMTIFSEGSFKYNWTGRYGEVFTIDSFDLFKLVPDPSFRSKYWGQTSNVVVKRNGSTIFEGRNGFEDIKWTSGEYDVEISTNNVILDETIQTSSESKLHFNHNGVADVPLPTVSNVQFRNNKDEVTDRFAAASDGQLCVYATSLQFITDSEGNVSVQYMVPATLTAEAAPAGTDNFQPITLTADPVYDNFYGFGSFYAGSLAGVTNASQSGWYDLRIKVTNGKGDTQEQLLHYAFNIDGRNSVENVEMEEGIYVEGRNIVAPASARIFTIAGIPSDGKEVAPGLYFVSNNGKCTKILIK